MEAKLGAQAYHLHPHMYGQVVSDLRSVRKRASLEWDLNDWRWDGDLFTATPAVCGTRGYVDLSNTSSSNSDEFEPPQRESEKRRRSTVIEEDDEDGEEGECLRLGGQSFPISRGDVKSGKKSKVAGVAVGAAVVGHSLNTGSSRAVCQVEDCRADLSGAKDYHRRHKVCEVHSKASTALVGNIMQRFCQQCSRFHVLQEFDEGKRSCRRRLAGHNKRRRKTHPDPVVSGGTQIDERNGNIPLLSLLRILSNMHSKTADPAADQDLVSHLLRSLASVAGTVDGRNIQALLQGSFNAGTSMEASQKPVEMILDGPETRGPLGSASKADITTKPQASSNSVGQCSSISVPNTGETIISSGNLRGNSGPASTNPPCLMGGLKPNTITVESTVERVKFKNFDLNSIYDDSQDHEEDLGSSHLPGTPETVYQPNDSHKSSPPQPSWNSDSTTTQSPSKSSGEAQSCTDRIVLKLFGKDPSDLPFDLRSQMLNWLSNTPADMESYIRPGCIILTVYLHLEKIAWDELCSDLGSCLKKLLDASDEPFWNTGWIYSRVGNYVAFTYNGNLVLDSSLPLKSSINCRISSIKPVAVSLSERTEFVVKGFNFSVPSTRLLCALDGKYLVQESCYELIDDTDETDEHNDIQCLRFSCSIPSDLGRGFIEVEDHGLSSSVFPFIVAEQEVCSEICTLEDVIEMAESTDIIEREPDILEAKNRATNFLHEMGWLLHRSHARLRLGHMDPNLVLFPFRRFGLLMEFSMDRDWCFVVKKLLGILFEGIVDAGGCFSVEAAILDMNLLHRAVRRNCKPMIELLLTYTPRNTIGETGSDENQPANEGSHSFLFKPDLAGPKGLTPLHIAASQVGYESVVDALTDDPGKVGIVAWKNARDDTGLTPNDYARLRGHYSYIHLVHRKMAKRPENEHVIVDIPTPIPDNAKQAKQGDGVSSLEIERRPMRGQCGRACHRQKIVYGNRSSLVYRPAMLSMVAVAAVCVCVALLFKSCPEVIYVFQPFRWEHLHYGSS